MRLTHGELIDKTGTISNREVHYFASGQVMAKATLVSDDGGEHFPVIWWELGQAPPVGARVRVKGRGNVRNGTAEIHARETSVDRTGIENGPLAPIAAFYLGCVEAETASSLQFTLQSAGKGHILLHNTASPLHGTLQFDADSLHQPWFRARQVAVGETLLSGWPLVVGTDAGESGLVATPLLVAEVELVSSDGKWWIRQLGAGVDLNPFALDLLGLSREQRDELLVVIKARVEAVESTTSAARSHAILQALQQEGIDGLVDLDPAALSCTPTGKGIHNAGAVMTATGNTRAIRNLVKDLEELANYPDLLSKGPAAVLLGQSPVPEVPLPAPHPVIALSSLQQDKVIHSAMVNDFTVVTGPPGTGKSQVIVNVVAAAVARRETVLFASKNNRAIDLVVDRLRSASPNAVIVRAGNAGQRNEVAEYIVETLSANPQDADSASASQAWAAIEKSLQSIYGVLHERSQIQTELKDLKAKREAALDRLPPGARIEIALPELDNALTGACKALDAFSNPLWFFGRWQRHRERLENARHALGCVSDILEISRSSLEKCLSSVADRPKRTLTPRKAFQAVEEIANDILAIAKYRVRINEFRARLAEMPRKHDLDDRLYALRKERLATGTRLLDARWEELRDDNRSARAVAIQLAELLERMDSDHRARVKAFRLIPDALPALPVWAVTNLSVRTNLPLNPGLFDLVVIDEASQCDIASALPIIVRGKRALIIGDQNQLVHITSLGRAREKIIAQKQGLTDDQAYEFSYRSRSCFELSSSRVLDAPIYLDLHFRSHPAIVSFSNEQFYRGKLELCSTATPPKGLRPVQWIHTTGKCERGTRGRSRVNTTEAQRVVQAIVRGLPTYKSLECSVGVVTPYAAQVELISELLSKALEPEELEALKVATTHRFQGDERDIIYFSPVVDRSMGADQIRFAADPNLINVTTTRARRRFIIVGDRDACLAHDNALKKLATYSLCLDDAGFDNPLEHNLYNALTDEDITARTDVVVGKHRLNLAIEREGMRLDIECDGVAFQTDYEKDAARDRAVESEGWTVIRFSSRALSRDLKACVGAIVNRLAL